MSSSVEQPRPRSGPTLSSRRAGHSAMTECLRLVRQHATGSDAVRALPEQAVSSWRGAHGELEVGAELALLPPEWSVLHALPAGPRGADIDHLVIGPGGVFVLSTRTHRRASIRIGEHVVWVGSGRGRPYQAGVQNDALRVSAALAPVLGARDVVRPVLVFVDAARLSPVGNPRVTWCRPGDLVALLTSVPPLLPPVVVTALVARAEQPTTWGRPLSIADEPDPTAEFLALTPDDGHRDGPGPLQAAPGRSGSRSAWTAAGHAAIAGTVVLLAQAILWMAAR